MIATGEAEVCVIRQLESNRDRAIPGHLFPFLFVN